MKEATVIIFSKTITLQTLYDILLFLQAFVTTVYMFICFCIFYLPSQKSKLHERSDLAWLFIAVLPTLNIYNEFQ